ncbi:Putative ankyrin repeat protein L25 [Fusarium oxysporum f. sp. cubense race 1]|uniref:Putative ankyrin repeat protein L25 n=1 Tax=Fusarium oxysporum f. sp. cubense (strain race 1) TaxID=1229664 RepID=N4UMF4_FUSC1|nr:Putative ankyrin repeat protein L25 [Fusarium oxysporum f. sp. cubense race 1]
MPEAEEYTIGWICALTKELIAAKVFLDFLHDPVDNAAINDDNNYTLGSIGKHNVVIAVLPYGQYGLVNATAALKDMTRTFSNLRAVLMVGIGGGVPCENDIRLGDIVVGSVGPSSGGVIQYDYGRAIQGEEFAVTGHLNQPPMAFLTAMSALHARYEMEGHSIDSNIDRALQRYKRLGKKYKRPEASTDRLYESNFVHQGSKGIRCSELCGNDNLVHRAERGEDENNPATHCGLIASGNQLVKNALLRDKLAAKHGILCFEMEAAGLMNHFPCVLIRGICDYSDSHKNDEWQEYAAMAAAAYTKDLLLQVAPSSVQKEERIETLLGRLNEKVDDVHQVTTESSRDIKSLSSSVRDDAISRWLNSTDPSVDHNKAREACHSGKTILSSTVIEDIRNSPVPQFRNCAILYFYITFTDSQKHIISLKTDNVGRDISEYVCDFVTKSTSFRRWHGQTSTQDDIVNTLTAKADGVFRWVALQLERLKDCINKEEVNTTLETLPETLQETYYRVLNELTSTRRKYVIRILQFLAYSDIPMELEAAVDALAINLTAPPGSRFVMKELCKIRRFENRAARHRATFLQLAHSSVKEFILSCPRTEFDGLLIEPTARLMITEICLVYFLEMNCFLSDEELMWTHHLLPFAVDSWIHDASCRLSRLNNFTHLSMELLSNELLFKRWNSSVTRDTTAWRLDPALHVASEFGHLEVAALLIREGADVNAEGEIHNVLCTAIKVGHTDIISLLIKEGADVNAQQGPYRNTFEVASRTGRLDIVELLIKPSADVNAHSSYTDALYSASFYGHLNLVMYLVEEGADVNAQGGYYGTALCVASCFGYLNIVTYLVEKGADVNAQGGCFENALQAALTRRRDTVVKFLQNHKANLRYDDVKPSPPW